MLAPVKTKKMLPSPASPFLSACCSGKKMEPCTDIRLTPSGETVIDSRLQSW